VRRLGIRHRLLLVVATTVAASLAALVAGFNILLAHNLSRDADNLVRARAAAELGQLRAQHGRLAVGEAPDDASADAQVWIFSDVRTLEAPRTTGQVAAAARRLSRGGHRFVDIRAPCGRFGTPARTLLSDVMEGRWRLPSVRCARRH